jgi:putative addiction module killer protein
VIIKQTKQYIKWFSKLNDKKTRYIILTKLKILINNMQSSGNNIKRLTSDLSELKINYGSGYRIYFTKQNNEIMILLVGGNKGTQNIDIQKAQEIIKNVKAGKVELK